MQQLLYLALTLFVLILSLGACYVVGIVRLAYEGLESVAKDDTRKGAE